jgi:hypothetical protein
MIATSTRSPETRCPRNRVKTTALSGQTLIVNGRPLGGVQLSVGDVTARTDETGRFLIARLPSGHQTVHVDGRSAGPEHKDFGQYEIGVEVASGTTTALPYTIWLTRLDTAHATSFPTPTADDTVIRTPLIPGFEVHLPKGSTVKDQTGQAVNQLSITARACQIFCVRGAA